MDRKQMVAQRVREVFADRLDDVLHMIRQDREGLRGWEEPAHVRAVLRRAIRENHSQPAEATIEFAELEFGRGAGEPDRGQQREAVGQVLEAGIQALEKIKRHAFHELTPEEVLGAECSLLLYGRPAILVNQGQLDAVPPFWNLLEDQREDIEVAARGVGRIELLGHPEYNWAGSGFLVHETCLLTTRRTAEVFAERAGEQWQFRPGITVWLDYRSAVSPVSSAGYRVRGVFGVHEQYDLALLEVEPPQEMNGKPTPLALAAEPPGSVEGRPVYLIGYPVRDARRGESENVARIFRDVYNVKRVQPGTIRGLTQFRDVALLHHDCAPLGLNAGACIVDLESHQVLGLHIYGRYLEGGTAVPLWKLRNDPLFQQAGVTFAEATTQQLAATANQVERLARSRYWSEIRDYVARMHERAFGPTPTRP